MLRKSDAKTTPSRGNRYTSRVGLRAQSTALFAALLLLVVGSAAASFVVLTHVVEQFSDAGKQLKTEAELVSTLNQQMLDHEGQGHLLIEGAQIPADEFLAEQAEIERLFAVGLKVLPPGQQRTSLRGARAAWSASLTEAGLWDSAAPPKADRASAHFTLADQSAKLTERLDAIRSEARRALDEQMAKAERSRGQMTLGLGAIFLLALITILYAARRTSLDVLQPVAALRKATEKLHAGDLTHRLDISPRSRRNDLSDLAEMFNDMAAALEESHQSLNNQALRDPLTKLSNRMSLQQRMSESFAPGVDRRHRHNSILFIDVDDFKTVNDSLGHARGDELLVQIAGRLLGCVRSNDLVARLGGDEFAIVVSEDENGAMATMVAGRILDAFAVPFLIQDVSLVVTTSIGVAVHTPDVSDVEEMLAQADFAMYMAKANGKARFEVFDPHMHAITTEQANLRSELRHAVDEDQLVLHYQPIYDLEHDQVVGVEALVRWQHPTRGLLSPYEFISAAEETGLIDAIGAWVLDTALGHVQTWRAEFPGCADMSVSINVSPCQLRCPHSVARICEILSTSGVPTDVVILEITESTLIADVEGGSQALAALKRTGVRLALDDFGVGMSSLSTLQQTPVDIIKIDRSFVSGAGPSLASEALVATVIGLATRLGLESIAEGIEDPAQQTALQALGCRLGQGYALARPQSAEAMQALLAKIHSEESGMASTPA